MLGERVVTRVSAGRLYDHKVDRLGVEPVRFDPARGYVNAVGRVRAAHTLAEITAFSPLGEVEFRERAEGGTESALSGPPRGEAL